MTDKEKWQIFRLLKIPQRGKELFWKHLDTLAIDSVWEDELMQIVDRLIAADLDPTSITATSTTAQKNIYVPGLRRANNVEFYEGKILSESNDLYGRWLGYLINLVGKNEFLCSLPPDACDCASGLANCVIF
jgi:hypothetical protein